MKIRNILPIAVGCLIAVAAFGQAKGAAGKWGTDGAAAKAAMAVMLDLKVDAGGKITGSITEYANALCGSPDTNLTIDSGMVMGNVSTFVTTRPNPCPAAGATGPVTGTAVTWTATLSDDGSTMSVTRAIAGGGGRGGGGGGGRGGAGAGGGAPGGAAPGAGAPPAGGPPAAAGAAPGGAPAGGAPGGGGGGGRGGGGGGRGGGGAMTMHRLP